jgi:hypothetical protein
MTNETHQQLHIVKRGPDYSEAAAEAREILATMVAEEEAAREDWADDRDLEHYYGPDGNPGDDLDELEMEIIAHNCWD